MKLIVVWRDMQRQPGLPVHSSCNLIFNVRVQTNMKQNINNKWDAQSSELVLRSRGQLLSDLVVIVGIEKK